MIIRAGASDEREACVSIWLDALRARDGAEQGPVPHPLGGPPMLGYALQLPV